MGGRRDAPRADLWSDRHLSKPHVIDRSPSSSLCYQALSSRWRVYPLIANSMGFLNHVLLPHSFRPSKITGETLIYHVSSTRS